MTESTTNTINLSQTVGLYVILLVISFTGIFLCLQRGQTRQQSLALTSSPAIENHATSDQSSTPSVATSGVVRILSRNSAGPLSRLFLQIGVVLGAAWILGKIFERFSQPMVIGEMVAGILLGPSFFGLIAPRAFEFLFAPSSLESLRLFSQLGVCLFMFVVGMELNLAELRHRAPRLLLISHGGILIPFLFG